MAIMFCQIQRQKDGGKIRLMFMTYNVRDNWNVTCNKKWIKSMKCPSEISLRHKNVIVGKAAVV